MAFADAAVQVDLLAAAKHGTVVFNAPFANTRSVAELMIAEVSCSYSTYPTCHRRPLFNPWLLLLRLLLRVTRVRHRNVAGMTSLCDHCTFAFRSYRCRAGWARSLRRCTAACGTRMQSAAARSAARRAASSATAMSARRSLRSPFKSRRAPPSAAHRRTSPESTERLLALFVCLRVGEFSRLQSGACGVYCTGQCTVIPCPGRDANPT